MTIHPKPLWSGAISAVVLAAGGTVTMMAGPAAAQSGTDFFKGKTVTYIVATGAGGGYDFYGRLVARYMEKQLPGSTFVVKNVPGAGHIIGANQIYHAKPNGQTIGIFNTGLIFSQVLKKKGVRFDLGKMTWLGKAASDPRVVMVTAQSPIKTIDDLRMAKETVKFSSSGVGSSGYNDTQMLGKVLGWNYKMILGYRGTDSELAMRRGEIDAAVGSLSSAELFHKNGYGRIIVQIGGKPAGEWPLLSNVVTEPNAKAIAALIGSQAELARFTAGPPGIPADRTAALRAAYKAALEEKELQAHAAKADRPIDPLYGEEVANLVRAALDQPPEVVALVKEILEAKPSSNKVTGTKLLTKTPDGRWITFKHGEKTIKSKISGSRTKITVAGNSANRKTLAAGMVCDIDYKPGGDNEPKTIDCK